MAQESIKINSAVLKHCRTKLGFTQQEMSAACNLSHRQYQRVEQTGQTSSATAEQIASKIGMTVEELSGDPHDVSLWYLQGTLNSHGALKQGFHEIVEQITEYAHRYSRDIAAEPSLHIYNMERSVKKVCLSYLQVTHEWLFRPVQLQKDTGLVWCDLSEWQEELWDEALFRLKYDLITSVHLDGSPVLPPSSQVNYCVLSFENESGVETELGYRTFDSGAECRVSLAHWLSAQQVTPWVNFDVVATLSINYFCHELKREKRIALVKRYRDSSGRWNLAPWPKQHRVKLAQAIKEYKTGGFALPIALNESFIGGNASPFLPDVVTNKVVEAPERGAGLI